MYGVPPPVGLGPRFQSFILGLCRSLGFPVDRARAPIPLMDQTFLALRRRLNRFLALLARFHAGTLPVACPRRLPPLERMAPERMASEGAVSAGAPREAVPPRRAPVPVPRDHGWLVRLVGYEAATYTGYLEILVADPEMAEFLAAAPQAGRLLRPLWRMLNAQPLPEVLTPPPRSPRLVRRPAAPAHAAPGRIPHEVAPGSPRVRRERLHVGLTGSGPPIPA